MSRGQMEDGEELGQTYVCAKAQSTAHGCPEPAERGGPALLSEGKETIPAEGGSPSPEALAAGPAESA